MALNFIANLALPTVIYALLAAKCETAVISRGIFGNSNSYNQTFDLSIILKNYVGKCHGFVTTMMYKKEGCNPVFKRNMICAGTCQSTVYPRDGGFKEFCQACQATKLTWERISFKCWKGKGRKFAWIQVVGKCQCSEVSCGLNSSDNI